MREMMQRLSRASASRRIARTTSRTRSGFAISSRRTAGTRKIETFDVLFPTPIERVVELVAPTTYKAPLQEPTVSGDPTSSPTRRAAADVQRVLRDGDVTGPLVFVNYGVPADYEELERRGISVKGAIVIAKYGGSWRGIKPKVAAEHGAIGCLIYSDPRDDGYGGGDVFPTGPMRPPQGVQRGSVADMPTYPGDPLTPGVGATKDAKRLPVADAPTITKIPVLPISYGDAQPLLAALDGTTVPAQWRGGLPITYRFGPGAARVHLKLKFDWSLKTLYDVIAQAAGHHRSRPVGHSRQPSRRVGERRRRSDLRTRRGARGSARVRRAVEAGMASEAHDHLRRVGRRGARAARLDRMGGGTRRSSTRTRSRISTATPTAAATSASRDRTRSRSSSTASRKDIVGSGVEGQLVEAQSGAAVIRAERRCARSRRSSHRRARLGFGLHAVSSASRHRVAQPRLRRRGRRRHLSLDLRRLLLVHAFQRHVVRLRPRAGAGRRDAVMRLADADVLPFAFTNLAATTQRYAKELQDLRDARARRSPSERSARPTAYTPSCATLVIPWGRRVCTRRRRASILLRCSTRRTRSRRRRHASRRRMPPGATAETRHRARPGG